MALFLLTAIIILWGWANSYQEDTIMTEIGVKMEKFGKVIGVNEDLMLSVIVKLPNISSIADEKRFNRGVMDMHKKCISGLRSIDTSRRKLAERFLNTWQEIRSYFSSMADKFIRNRLEILQPFMTPLTDKKSEIKKESTREKRSFWSFVGNSAITLLMGGITEIQIHNINKHVQRNADNINLLKRAILADHSEIQQLSDEVFGFVQKATNKITYMYYEDSCASFYSSMTMKLRHEFLDWTKKVDERLWTGIKGENSLLLTPRMLDLDMVKEIIRKNEMLKSTIFQQEPSFLYSLSKLTIVEIDKTLNYAHFVLMVPLVTDDATNDVYKTTQVGSHIGQNNCVYQDIPKFIYQTVGTLKSLNLEGCRIHNNLYVCPTENLSNETSCLQVDNNDCGMQRHRCSYYYQFTMSRSGILLRNNKDRNTFAIDKKGLTYSVKLGKYSTTHLYWKDVIAVQIGNQKIVSPNTNHVPLSTPNITLNIPALLHYINEDNITDIFGGLCKKYNKTLDDLVTPIFGAWQEEGKDFKFSKWVVFTFVSVVFMLFIGAAIWLTWVHVQLTKLYGANNAGHSFSMSNLNSQQEKADRHSV